MKKVNISSLKPIKTKNNVILYADPNMSKNKVNRIYDKWGNSITSCNLEMAFSCGIYQEV